MSQFFGSRRGDLASKEAAPRAGGPKSGGATALGLCAETCASCFAGLASLVCGSVSQDELRRAVVTRHQSIVFEDELRRAVVTRHAPGQVAIKSGMFLGA